MMFSNLGKVLSCGMAYPDQLHDLLNVDSSYLLFITDKAAALKNLVTSNHLDIINAGFGLRDGYKLMNEGVMLFREKGFAEAGKLLFKKGIPTTGKLIARGQLKQLCKLGISASAHLFMPGVGSIAFLGIEILADIFVDKYISPWFGRLAEKAFSAVTNWLRSIS